MKLIVGLGNPGPEYTFTPHNAGFLAIDRIADQSSAVVANRRSRALTGKAFLAGEECLLVKPETFMNLSGLAVSALVKEFDLDPTRDLIVLYDELAFPLGDIQLRPRGSSNGHNGAQSITGALGTQDWIRVRIGVGKPSLPDGREVKAGGKEYLLTPMRKTELAVMDEVLDRVAKAVEMVVSQGIAAAMNQFNRRDEK